MKSRQTDEAEPQVFALWLIQTITVKLEVPLRVTLRISTLKELIHTFGN